jgi:hypothetical protein
MTDKHYKKYIYIHVIHHKQKYLLLILCIPIAYEVTYKWMLNYMRNKAGGLGNKEMFWQKNS